MQLLVWCAWHRRHSDRPMLTAQGQKVVKRLFLGQMRSCLLQLRTLCQATGGTVDSLTSFWHSAQTTGKNPPPVIECIDIKACYLKMQTVWHVDVDGFANSLKYYDSVGVRKKSHFADLQIAHRIHDLSSVRCLARKQWITTAIPNESASETERISIIVIIGWLAKWTFFKHMIFASNHKLDAKRILRRLISYEFIQIWSPICVNS